MKEKDLEQTVREEVEKERAAIIKDIEWHINYHKEKLKHYEIKLEIVKGDK